MKKNEPKNPLSIQPNQTQNKEGNSKDPAQEPEEELNKKAE